MGFLAVAEELAVKGLTTDSKPAGTDTPAKKAVVSQKQKRSLPPGSSSTPTQAAKKPKPSQSMTPSEDIEIEPHLEDVDIKSIKAEPEPSGSGSGGPGGSHAAMVEADLGDESYGASGADGEFEGFDQYGEGNEFDDSMGAAGGSGAAADGKVQFVQRCYGKRVQTCLLDSDSYVYSIKETRGTWTTWRCICSFKDKCQARCYTINNILTRKIGEHKHAPTFCENT